MIAVWSILRTMACVLVRLREMAECALDRGPLTRDLSPGLRMVKMRYPPPQKVTHGVKIVARGGIQSMGDQLS
jgi:hypothetical protein